MKYAFILLFLLFFAPVMAQNVYVYSFLIPLNHTITWTGSDLQFSQNINPDGVTFVNFTGATFYFLYGQKTFVTNITSNQFWFRTNATINNWMVMYYPLNQTLILKASPSFPSSDFFDLNKIFQFFNEAWGIGTYILMFFVALTVYLKTRSPGAFAIILLVLAAVRFAFERTVASVAYLAVALVVSYLIYKIMRGREY